MLFDLTVLENVQSFAHFTGGESASMALLDELGLSEKLHVRAGSLSGGERRKLELTRALSARPRVLLCDEPFAALDPMGKRRVGSKLVDLARSGAAVLIADHDVREALGLCQRAALLLGGRLVCEAEPEAFAREALVRAHYAALDDWTG